jgi:DNA-binding phage protein
MLLYNGGVKITQIARETGVSRSTIYRVLSSDKATTLFKG